MSCSPPSAVLGGLHLLDDERRITASLSSVTQVVHPYRHSGLFLFYPSIFFYPSGNGVPPTNSLHAAAGYERSLHDDAWLMGVEAYYRVTRNLHEFASDSTLPVSASLTDVLLAGEGTSYGVEARIEKRLGDLTGSIRYALAWSDHRFDALNQGQPFEPRFDRRHEVTITASYTVDDAWSLGAVCVLSSSRFPSIRAEGVAAAAKELHGDVNAAMPAITMTAITPDSVTYSLIAWPRSSVRRGARPSRADPPRGAPIGAKRIQVMAR